MKSLSRLQLLATPWTAAYQAPLSMGFSRQEYWSGLVLIIFLEDKTFSNFSKANFGITSVSSGSIIVTFREWRDSGGFLASTRKGDDHRGAGGWQLTPADWHDEQSDSEASFGKYSILTTFCPKGLKLFKNALQKIYVERSLNVFWKVIAVLLLFSSFGTPE